MDEAGQNPGQKKKKNPPLLPLKKEGEGTGASCVSQAVGKNRRKCPRPARKAEYSDSSGGEREASVFNPEVRKE